MNQTTRRCLGIFIGAVVAASLAPGSAVVAGEPTPSLPEKKNVLVPYGAGGYRYVVVERGEGAGFEEPGYDASGFSYGASPFGSGGYCGLPFETMWPPDTDLLVRKTVEVPTGAGDLAVSLAVDNDARVFWNGHQLVGVASHEGCAEKGSATLLVPNRLIERGENLLAIRGLDFGDQTYLDATVVLLPKYVAFGDSVASGEGVQPFDDYEGREEDHWCHRSAYAYSRVLAYRHALPMQLVACSGARMSHITALEHVKKGLGDDEWVPPQTDQVDALSGTQLITVTVGVNDLRTTKYSIRRKTVGWSNVIRHCAKGGDCRPLFPDLTSDIFELQPRLASLFERLYHEAEESHIAVVGYPHFFARPQDAVRRGCKLNGRELRWMRARFREFTQMMRFAVQDALSDLPADAGISFVNTLQAFEGHERCSHVSETNRWVHGATPSHREFSYHPKRSGQIALSRVVERHLVRSGIDLEDWSAASS